MRRGPWRKLYLCAYRDPKIKDLAAELGVLHNEAAGMVMGLWCEARPDGTFNERELRHLESALHWEGAPGALLRALFDVQLLDQLEDGGAELHDRFMYGGSFALAAAQKVKRDRARADDTRAAVTRAKDRERKRRERQTARESQQTQATLDLQPPQENPEDRTCHVPVRYQDSTVRFPVSEKPPSDNQQPPAEERLPAAVYADLSRTSTITLKNKILSKIKGGGDDGDTYQTQAYRLPPGHAAAVVDPPELLGSLEAPRAMSSLSTERTIDAQAFEVYTRNELKLPAIKGTFIPLLRRLAPFSPQELALATQEMQRTPGDPSVGLLLRKMERLRAETPAAALAPSPGRIPRDMTFKDAALTKAMQFRRSLRPEEGESEGP